MSEVDWDRLYWEQSPRLYNFFRYRTGDSEAAKDLTSRTLMKAWHVQSDGEAQPIGEIASPSVTIAPDLSYIVGSDDGKIVLWSVPASDASGD